MFESKRGITPLVATVLLVAFSVGLGALVMSWGEEYIEQKAEFTQGTTEVKSGCDVAKIALMIVSGRQQVCFGQEGLELWIDNGPDVELYNIHARIAGVQGVDVKEEILKQPLIKSNAVKATVAYNAGISPLLQVKLTPKIWTGKTVAMCEQKAIEIENIKPC